MHRHSLIVRFSLLCLALVTCTTFASAQKKKDGDDKEKKYKEDPYTENIEDVWRVAGYEAMGDFGWADGHGTVNIEDAIGEEELIFIETKHFKIGCCLPSYKISREDKIEKDKIELKLDELNIKRIPSATNFITTYWGSENNAKEITENILDKGIILRHLTSFGWPEYVRISIGLEDENEYFVKTLEEII